MLLRAAHPGEEPALCTLAMRSKAHWGYDAAFLAACCAELAVREEQVGRRQVTVAVDAGRAVGFTAVDDDLAEPELVALFVEPAAIGCGVGCGVAQSGQRAGGRSRSGPADDRQRPSRRRVLSCAWRPQGWPATLLIDRAASAVAGSTNGSEHRPERRVGFAREWINSRTSANPSPMISTRPFSDSRPSSCARFTLSRWRRAGRDGSPRGPAPRGLTKRGLAGLTTLT